MIVTIPFCNADKDKAERLLDCIYWFGGQKPTGHLLLVAAPDVNQEFKIKMRLAGEVAFETVAMAELDRLDQTSKITCINGMFREAARCVQELFKEPFLWMEPDCVPIQPNWLNLLESTYAAQPRRYMGRHMKTKDSMFLSRVAVYPCNAWTDLAKHCQSDVPFERIAGLIPRSTSSTLFHIDKVFKVGTAIPNEVVLLNQEKTGTMIEQLIENAAIKPIARPRGRPRKIAA